MAGITAVSASQTLSSGSTSADNSSAGWVTGESILLGVTPSGSSYAWSQSVPSASTQARSALGDDDILAPSFTPDVGGTYVLSCLVSGVTQYTLKLTVQNAATSELEEALRWSPRLDTTITAPTLGLVQYFSDTFDNLSSKDPSDRVWPLLTGAMGASLADEDATITVAQGQRRAMPASTMSANRSLTLSDSGAVAGDTIELARLDTTAFTLAVINGGAGAGTLITMPVSVGLYTKYTFGGTNWTLTERRLLG
jgi:hypothetical protein